MESKLEAALLIAIQKISIHFGPKAVLRGGMALRLQGLSRSTIDADFCFQPTRHKKKDFGEELIQLISQLSETPLSINYHSSILQIIATLNGVSIIIEGSTSESFEPTLISTAPLALRLQQQPCLISIMPNDMSLSHKLAAWLERRLMRDLYDIYILYERLDASPDLDILRERLLNLNHLKGVKPRFKSKTIEEFLLFLKEQVQLLNPDIIEAQLQGIIDDRELNGIGTHIKTIVSGIHF